MIKGYGMNPWSTTNFLRRFKMEKAKRNIVESFKNADKVTLDKVQGHLDKFAVKADIETFLRVSYPGITKNLAHGVAYFKAAVKNNTLTGEKKYTKKVNGLTEQS